MGFAAGTSRLGPGGSSEERFGEDGFELVAEFGGR